MGAMKEIATELEERGIKTEDCDIIVTRSTIDGALLIIVDTREDIGRVRIDLNDGPIWDGDPEEDVPAMLDGFEVALWTREGITAPTLHCINCNGRVIGATMRRPLREYVQAAKLHNCTDGDTE